MAYTGAYTATGDEGFVAQLPPLVASGVSTIMFTLIPPQTAAPDGSFNLAFAIRNDGPNAIGAGCKHRLIAAVVSVPLELFDRNVVLVGKQRSEVLHETREVVYRTADITLDLLLPGETKVEFLQVPLRYQSHADNTLVGRRITVTLFDQDGSSLPTFYFQIATNFLEDGLWLRDASPEVQAKVA